MGTVFPPVAFVRFRTFSLCRTHCGVKGGQTKPALPASPSKAHPHGCEFRTAYGHSKITSSPKWGKPSVREVCHRVYGPLRAFSSRDLGRPRRRPFLGWFCNPSSRKVTAPLRVRLVLVSGRELACSRSVNHAK